MSALTLFLNFYPLFSHCFISSLSLPLLPSFLITSLSPLFSSFLSPHLLWENLSILGTIPEATCRMLGGEPRWAQPSPTPSPTPRFTLVRRHTESCPVVPPRAAEPKALLPFKTCVHFCPPSLSGVSIPLRGRAPFVLLCVWPPSLPLEPWCLQHNDPSASSWDVLSCLCPHWLPSLHLLCFPLWIYTGSACYIISSDQSCPNMCHLHISGRV